MILRIPPGVSMKLSRLMSVARQMKNQIVWSVFYKVDPSDVRHQRNTYEKAMVKHETRYGKYSEKVKKWKSALSQVCDLNAFHYKKNSRYVIYFLTITFI